MQMLDEILGQAADRPIAVIHNAEGANSLDGKLENLRRLFDRVVAYLMLAHVYKNSAVHLVFPNPESGQKLGCFPCGRDLTRGLTEFGEQIVEAMIEMDMITRTIDHLVKVEGIEHVGIGTDLDGLADLPNDLKDVSQLPRITQRLLAEEYSRTEIERIWGGNALRVLRQGCGR